MRARTVRMAVLVVAVLALAGVTGGAAAETEETAGNWSDDAEEVLPAPAGDQSASAGAVSVSLAPSASTIPPGEQQSYDVVVSGATGGVAAMEFSLSVADTAVGEFVDYDPANDPLFYDSNISADGKTVDTIVALGDNKHGPADIVTVATVTVEGSESATGMSSAIAFGNAEVMDNKNLFYNVTDTGNATVGVDKSAVGIDPRPADQRVLGGSPLTVEVAVNYPTGGVGAFDIDLSVAGNGSVTGYDLPREGTDTTEIADNGSLISLSVELAEPHDPAGTVVVAEVTVVGHDPGTLRVEPTGGAVTDAGGEGYVSGFDTASVSVVDGPPPVPGRERVPKDLDGDLYTEDVDGDGEFTIFDVQALFNTFDSEVVQANPETFDFESDGEINIFDVQAVFDALG